VSIDGNKRRFLGKLWMITVNLDANYHIFYILKCKTAFTTLRGMLQWFSSCNVDTHCFLRYQYNCGSSENAHGALGFWPTVMTLSKLKDVFWRFLPTSSIIARRASPRPSPNLSMTLTLISWLAIIHVSKSSVTISFENLWRSTTTFSSPFSSKILFKRAIQLLQFQ